MAPLMQVSLKKKLFNTTPPKTNEIKVKIMYLDLADLVTANAQRIISAIDFSFGSISF